MFNRRYLKESHKTIDIERAKELLFELKEQFIAGRMDMHEFLAQALDLVPSRDQEMIAEKLAEAVLEMIDIYNTGLI